MRYRTVHVRALHHLCVTRNMTLAELSRRSGVSYSMIKYVFAGRRQFSDLTAKKIARALSCSVEDFTTPKPERLAS